MPTGIILKSASHEESEEVRQKNLEAVVESAGYEPPEKPEVEEPKREAFKTEEEFESAHVAWQDAYKTPTPEKEDEEDEEDTKLSPRAVRRRAQRARAIASATADMQRELDKAKARIAELEKKDEPSKEQPRPKRADFESDEKYEDALLAWGVVKATQEKAVKEAQDAEKARVETIIGNYGLQVEEAKEAHADWDELKEKFDDPKNDINIGHATQLAILELENGAEVTYYLMRHPAYAAKLGKMSEVSAVMEVGRLSVRLKTDAPAPSDADDEEKPKPKPKVPAPVQTVSTRGSNAAPTFAEIAAKPNYPGKARDLRKAMAAGE